MHIILQVLAAHYSCIHIQLTGIDICKSPPYSSLAQMQNQRSQSCSHQLRKHGLPHISPTSHFDLYEPCVQSNFRGMEWGSKALHACLPLTVVIRACIGQNCSNLTLASSNSSTCHQETFHCFSSICRSNLVNCSSHNLTQLRLFQPRNSVYVVHVLSRTAGRSESLTPSFQGIGPSALH